MDKPTRCLKNRYLQNAAGATVQRFNSWHPLLLYFGTAYNRLKTVQCLIDISTDATKIDKAISKGAQLSSGQHSYNVSTTIEYIFISQRHTNQISNAFVTYPLTGPGNDIDQTRVQFQDVAIWWRCLLSWENKMVESTMKRTWNVMKALTDGRQKKRQHFNGSGITCLGMSQLSIWSKLVTKGI